MSIPLKKCPFDALKHLVVEDEAFFIYRIDALEQQGITHLDKLPFTIRILLENLLRHCSSDFVSKEMVLQLASWKPGRERNQTIPFMPARVILQDFTGIPALVDLAAMRSAMVRFGGDPLKINPVIPADLVIDHSVQVDRYGTSTAFQYNVEKEIERNRERYTMLRWGQKAFQNFRVVPPGTGIVHQVNLEYLASVVQISQIGKQQIAFPDTLVGTDSHTTMINSLGVLGWGVGGIEAEAVLLGQPYYMIVPEVVGVKLTGQMQEPATATDLVLTITELLRKKGVVGSFVEFFSTGLNRLSLPDRATLANMSPEYGATAAFFPVDRETLDYLYATGRPSKQVKLIEEYTKAQRLFYSDDTPEPDYTVVYEVDIGRIEPSLAGPRKPQERIALTRVKDTFMSLLPEMLCAGVTSQVDNYSVCGCWADEGGSCRIIPSSCAFPAEPRTACRSKEIKVDEQNFFINDGSVVIAAITSCTNTSNPSVMIGAGLLARNAVRRGLKTKPWVKTSLAPGSRVVKDYLIKAGLLPFLESLGFHIVGYGCTTCIGNSGPLATPIAEAIEENQLITTAVLSGNRNFEARIHPYVRANYLASPMLVVAYALAGTLDTDLLNDSLGDDQSGNPVYLKELWPKRKEINKVIAASLNSEMFTKEYASVFEGERYWHTLEVSGDALYPWTPTSTYIQEPPFFKNMEKNPPSIEDITGARILAVFGDTLTTDHISPAGAIPKDSPAGRYLIQKGVFPDDFNSFGSRRGNHEVMLRGTFGNIRIRNQMTDREGGWTVYGHQKKMMTIYEAAMNYQMEGIPLVVIAGKDYGAGSSRDWAAKGTFLLNVKAVIAESFERIHRSNLVGMGVLPLQFEPGVNAASLGLTGLETLDIKGLTGTLVPGSTVTVRFSLSDSRTAEYFQAIVRLDNETEVEYYRHGGILQKVLRQFLSVP